MGRPPNPNDKIYEAGPDQGNIMYLFYCPGCETLHPFHVPRWSWNGSFEKPTFHPSLKCFMGSGPLETSKICHCIITNGKIQFLEDCYHKLVNQTIDMINWIDKW